MRYLIVLLAVGMLAGCAITPAQKAEQVKARAEAMRVEYGPVCKELGIHPDSKVFDSCVSRLYQDDRQRWKDRITNFNTFTNPIR